ncbi:coiled-coil domain-containing protein 33-like isoform X1 [Saccostrea echinata]|uniref:coiled-coil domain-containing protein 33-like isoform X1 n=1 Tax=Saccostrea echinata TaxID=191078 RepID=UPI002A7F49B6|nr:coiled-coil domain-containing protein 33-like isoform X1 [Saccostrea echinata]
MESLTSHLPKVDDKALEFQVDIQDAQFNHEGRYFLRLSIQSLHTKDYSGVQVQKGYGAPYTNENEAETDVVTQQESAVLSRFQDKQFTFRLPVGFCKNDKNHDLYLLVEAFNLPNNGGMGKKVGEGKFAIYPRPNAPKIKANVEPGEDFYNYTDVLSLLRTVSTDSVQMHCGRIRSVYALREVVAPKPKSPLKTPPKKIKKKQTPPPSSRPVPKPKPPPSPTSSWGGDNISILLPSSPPYPPLSDNKRVKEDPLEDKDRHTYHTESSYRHVSKLGEEQIDVIFHGASSLPNTESGTTPQAFIILKKSDEDQKGSVTHTSLRPTSSPSWEEMIKTTLDSSEAGDEFLVVSVADGPSKQELVDYKIPVNSLQPFHQYHLELVKPKKGVPNGVRVFASITRKLSKLPKDASSPNYLGLEVLLQAVQKPLQTSMGPLIAVARIVPDFYNYRSNYLISNPRAAGVTMTSVSFPSPHPASFSVPPGTKHGYPQISLPGKPDVQPVWNHPYLFCDERDKATLFTPSAALVIEYYHQDTAMTDQFWKVKSPMGFSALQLDKDLYKELIKENAVKGLRVDNLPVQGTDIVTIEGTQPTVGVILKLITNSEPDAMVRADNLESLPALDLFPEPSAGYFRTGDDANGVKSPEVFKVNFADETSWDSMGTEKPESPPQQPGYYLQKVYKKPMSPNCLFQVYSLSDLQPIKDGDLPPYEAMESILPDYQYIFVDPDNKSGRPPQRPPAATQLPGATSSMPGGPSTSYQPANLDQTSMNVLDHQMKELENYRTAVHKMGQDILALRQQIRELEANNSQLRRDLANYNDAGKLMIESAELDNLTKPEVMSRYAALKQTLQSNSGDIQAYKDKVQKLQNELIKKNDQEKRYIKIAQNYKQQNEVITKLQEKLKKMRTVEEACKKQEKVIEKMEKILEKQHRDRGKKSTDAAQEANEALLEENKRLRQQADDLRDQLRLSNKGSSTSETDKLELYQALEKAEARIQSLETQLLENSRSWGKERADMLLKLNEAEHGFGRSAGMVLHDYPVYNDKLARNSPRRLSPLYR